MNKEKQVKEVYSLWLMPTGLTFDRLQVLITQLSEEYETPAFAPHVTLIGELNINKDTAILKTTELAAKLEPLHLTMRTAECYDEYFRCVFLKAEMTPALLQANAAARAIFGIHDQETFLPHLSLVYGDLDRRTKQKIVGELGSRANVAFIAEGIHLYYTGEKPENWHCISKIPFAKRH